MNEETARRKIADVKAEVKKWLFGIDHAIDKLTMCLFTLVPYTAQGRKEFGQASVLLTDLPGVGKTDLIRSFAFAIGAKSALVAGHPEMAEADIIGAEGYIVPLGKFFHRKGPIFTNIFLHDEINRTHPKGQAPSLQAMEERIAILPKTNIETGVMEAVSFPLFPISDDPDEKKFFFWYLATRNPIEQEGTYPVPEAQLDRFTASFSIGLPVREGEKEIRARNIIRNKAGERLEINKILTLAEALEISHLILDFVSVPGNSADGAGRVDEYMMRLIENSRPGSINRRSATDELKKFIDENLKAGVSPRANFHFEALARTKAFFEGRNYVSLDDVKFVAPLVMSHRLVVTPAAIGAGIKEADIVGHIIADTEVPI